LINEKVEAVKGALTDALNLATEQQLTEVATACCTILDFFEGMVEEDGTTKGWIIGLKALDALVEDALDVRMGDEMESGA
jgi:hypothetical protein